MRFSKSNICLWIYKKGDAINAGIVIFIPLRPTTSFQAIARCVSAMFHMLQHHNTCLDVQAFSSNRLPNLISHHWTNKISCAKFQ